jgi:protein TonB
MLMRLPLPSTSFLRKRGSSGPSPGHLDARFRGDDDKGPGRLDAHFRARDDKGSGIAIACLASVGLHALLLAALLLWLHRTPPSVDLPQKSGEVELVLEEQQGSGPTTAPPEPAPSPAAPAAPQQAMPSTPLPPPAETTQEAQSLPPPPVPPPTPAPSVPRQAQPPMQHAHEAPQINLGGNGAETDATVTGPHVIPASVDAKFRNLEPVYPPEAVRRAEQGTVILAIHVSPDGLPTGVDVVQSSGFVLLDRTARDTVMGWHFLPAVQDGQPIPFDMKFRVVFHLD